MPFQRGLFGERPYNALAVFVDLRTNRPTFRGLVTQKSGFQGRLDRLSAFESYARASTVRAVSDHYASDNPDTQGVARVR